MSDRTSILRSRYGELITAEDLTEILRYRSVTALLKANERGVLPVPLVKLPGRKGWFATASAVAQFFDEVDYRLSERSMEIRRLRTQKVR